MDNTFVLTLNEDFGRTLDNNHPPFKKITKQQFHAIQNNLTCLRTMVYRTEEAELTCGQSEIIFHSLCYVKRKKETEHFEAVVAFRIPPSEFFGEKEELAVLQWLKTDKGKFLQGRYTPTHHKTATLSEEELKEVNACMDVFKGLQEEMDVELLDEIDNEDIDIQLPNFSVGLDFLSFNIVNKN